MRLFRKPLQPGQRVFRPFVLAAIVMVAVYGFWMNNQKRLDAIILQGLFTDQTGTVSARDKDVLLAQLKNFKPAFGMPLEVSVLTRPPLLSRHDPARIYLDILPKQKSAMLTLPPIARRAVGDEFVGEIEALFAQAFAAEEWQRVLVPAVTAIRNKLAEVNR